MDYTPVNKTLTFSPGRQSICINIPINDNSIVENDRTFNVGLSTGDESIILNNNMSQVIIKDNDSELRLILKKYCQI